MEFLVAIQIRLPESMALEQRESLADAESKLGRDLLDSGRIVRIWRVPGRSANVGIWSAADATELDDVLGSLPLYPWMDITVEPLAIHPLER